EGGSAGKAHCAILPRTPQPDCPTTETGGRAAMLPALAGRPHAMRRREAGATNALDRIRRTQKQGGQKTGPP
ncbi:hypothetical protein, partial [Leptospirillum ferriphilum]|uniref:hypothetical protein n=1 Tax=Leptospirillum ferriphilum TaxID=178606 RepID=UPI001C4E23F0